MLRCPCSHLQPPCRVYQTTLSCIQDTKVAQPGKMNNNQKETSNITVWSETFQINRVPLHKYKTWVWVVAISNARFSTVIVEWKPELWGCKGTLDPPSGDGNWVPPPSDADSDLYTTTNDSSIVFPGWLISGWTAPPPPRGRGGIPCGWGFCFGKTTKELSIRVEPKTLLAPWIEDPCIPAPFSLPNPTTPYLSRTIHTNFPL